MCSVYLCCGVYPPSREPCYLQNPASCGLHSKNSKPAAAKLKAGPMVRDERGLCAEAESFHNAATGLALVDFYCYIFFKISRVSCVL